MANHARMRDRPDAQSDGESGRNASHLFSNQIYRICLNKIICYETFRITSVFDRFCFFMWSAGHNHGAGIRFCGNSAIQLRF